MTSDDTHTYQYDGEGRLASIDGGATVAQVYNALGQQVQVNWAGGAWNVLFDPTGRWVGRNTAGHWDVGGVFHLGGRQVGIYIDQFYGIHENVLGSSDSTTNAAGSETGQSLFYPWGQTWTLGSAAWNFSAFEYGSPAPILYPTLFRTYNPALGRWMSPDPLGGDVTNPQSLNRYGYVTNNPTTLTDPLGLYNPFECDPLDPIDCGPPSCYFGDPGDCPPCDPVFGCPPPPPGGGGRGGSSAGSGGAPAPPSAPPAGQPPLGGSGGLPAGFGNAFLGFHVECTQSTVGGGSPSAWDCIVTFFGRPLGSFHLIAPVVAGSAFVPLIPAGPVAASGLTISGAIIAKPFTACLGAGPGIAAPATKGVGGGPLLFGNLSNARAVLSGPSVSAVLQPVPAAGSQDITNSSGSLGGPTAGTPGASFSFTVSGCKEF